jgi:FkbH-like protein
MQMDDLSADSVITVAEPAAGAASLANPLKLVIWDLDETFWQGTLSEEAITLSDRNIEIVKELCRRGILSSICSKNNFGDVQKVLEENQLWDYFVFPIIAFEAKGRAIASMIEQAGLRPDNCLFLDDNPLNLSEASYFAPNLMTALPEDILPALLSLPQAKGKSDPEMTRLQQYKNLEKKVADRETTALDNSAFLRSCDIKISIDLDVESEFDRVVELINRSNQLNYTKKRLETPEAREEFRASLNAFGAHAGLIRAHDSYGDYGIIGFFHLFNRAGGNTLQHFVFSCRTMNMGIEQFIFEKLNSPNIEVVGPVSNPIVAFDKVDWISIVEAGDIGAGMTAGKKLLLLGGCDLLQVANYCSPDREEFVNYTDNDVIVRYDDPGFILTPRTTATRSQQLPTIPTWSAEDAIKFDAVLGEAKVIIVSLWDALFGQYLQTDDDVLLRLDEGSNGLGDYLSRHPDLGFGRQGTFIEFSPSQKIRLIEASLDRIVALSPGAEHRFLIGRNLIGATSGSDLRTLYNRAMQAYAERTGQFQFVDVDRIVPAAEIIDGTHYTRMGYFKMAQHIGALLDQPSKLATARAPRSGWDAALPRIVKRSFATKKGAPVGKLARTILRLPVKLSGGRIAL